MIDIILSTIFYIVLNTNIYFMATDYKENNRTSFDVYGLRLPTLIITLLCYVPYFNIGFFILYFFLFMLTDECDYMLPVKWHRKYLKFLIKLKHFFKKYNNKIL